MGVHTGSATGIESLRQDQSSTLAAVEDACLQLTGSILPFLIEPVLLRREYLGTQLSGRVLG